MLRPSKLCSNYAMAAKRIRCGRLGVATRPFAGTMHYVAEKPTSLSEWWVKYENTAIAIHETADIATVLALWFSIDAVCGGMGFDYALALKEVCNLYFFTFIFFSRTYKYWNSSYCKPH